MGEGHLNSYFYKKSKSYKVCNGSKVRCVLIPWLGLEIETPKSNQQSLEFKIALVWCLLLILSIQCGHISLFFLKKSKL